MLAALDDDAGTVRRAAAAAIARHGTATQALVEILGRGSERAQEAAVLALAGAGATSRGPIRAWALGRVERASALRRHATALGDGTNDPALAFLRVVVDRRGRRIEDQLMTAVAALGAPQASGLLRRCLRSPDPTRVPRRSRRSMRWVTGGWPRGSWGCSTATARAPARQRTPPCTSCMDDPDPWLRTIAICAGAEVGDSRLALARAGNDPIRPCAQAWPHAAERRTDHGGYRWDAWRARSHAVLAGVPLFSQLDPEDLQRLAATATERLYGQDEALVREGDSGDELIVLVTVGPGRPHRGRHGAPAPRMRRATTSASSQSCATGPARRRSLPRRRSVASSSGARASARSSPSDQRPRWPCSGRWRSGSAHNRRP